MCGEHICWYRMMADLNYGLHALDLRKFINSPKQAEYVDLNQLKVINLTSMFESNQRFKQPVAMPVTNLYAI